MKSEQLSNIKEGSILGKSIYDNKGNLILVSGTYLDSAYLEKLKRDGLSEIQIATDSQIVDNVEAESTVSKTLTIDAVNSIKQLFLAQSQESITTEQVGGIAKGLLTEIIKNKNALINMVDIKIYDDYTYYHCVNVAIISVIIGLAMKLPEKQLTELLIAGLLHDIGKVFVPLSILNKNGKLDNKEFAEMKKHSELGYRYIEKLSAYPEEVQRAVLQHHERFDGRGYPESTKGDNISLLGRILTVADVYDALVSTRPYRKALASSEAVEHIMANNNTMFDPKVVEAFLERVCPYPVGSVVRLSNDIFATVISNNKNHILRPIIGLFDGTIIDLATDKRYLNIIVLGIANISNPIRVGE